MTVRPSRRQFLALTAAAAAACRSRSGARCAFCGMPIDPKSSWNAELALVGGGTAAFDTPKCALLSWRSRRTDAASIRVQDYYDRSWRDGAEVLFVASSDVVGPMGPDIVPVDKARARQFAREHTGTRPLPLDEVTLELLEHLR